MKRRIVVFFAALCLLAGIYVAAAADHSSLPAREEKERPELDEVRVYLRDMLSGRGYINNGEIFMSLSEFSGLYGINMNLTADDEGFAAVAEGLDISAAYGTNYLTVNHRYVFLPDGYILCGRYVYLPADALSRIFGVKLSASEDRVDISTKQCRPISGSEDYYKLNMPPDYQYWIPRIIKVETVDEPLAGKIAVGNVIENRVESDRYPDSIYKVLYDNNTGVQFAPATTGALTAAGDELSWVAACLCWEGYDTAEDSLYFANPENNGNYWFKTNCVYVKTIGRHEFYK